MLNEPSGGVKRDTGASTETKSCELRHQRGNRDGRAGLNPSSTSSDYMRGYVQGRRVRIERSLRT